MTERIDPRTSDLSRRDFLSAAAGLTLALTVTPDPLAILGVEDPSGTAKAEAALSPNVWLTISTDGTITIVSPAAEMGQGTFTTLPAVIADELDADWATVKPVFPPEWNERKFGNPGYDNYAFQTSASFAVRGYFKAMRIAGAQARRVLIDAVRLAKAVGKPVKLIWTREDDVTGGKFRPMTAHHIEAGFDASGKLIAWHHRVVAESVAAYTSIANGTPPPSLDRVVMKGSPIPQYPIPNKLAEHVIETRGARLAAFRGVGNAYNAFAAESLLDEIAKDRGLDPTAFRLTLSEGQPRMQTLLRTVAEMSDWARRRDGRGLGVGTMVKDDTLAAGVAEVSVDRATGKIKVHNFWAAIDAGLAVQPRNVAAQTEGSIVYALGHVLREKITIRDGRVLESNYSDYEVTRMSDVPNIEVKVVSTDNPPTGAGEDGVPVVACAVGNAIAALTGVRLRELPFAPERVRGALGA